MNLNNIIQNVIISIKSFIQTKLETMRKALRELRFGKRVEEAIGEVVFGTGLHKIFIHIGRDIRAINLEILECSQPTCAPVEEDKIEYVVEGHGFHLVADIKSNHVKVKYIVF